MFPGKYYLAAKGCGFGECDLAHNLHSSRNKV